jgi:nitrite reductase (NADH) large subunit
VPGSRSYQFTDERKQIYKKIVVSDCGKRLLGACWSATPRIRHAAADDAERIELPESPEFLILPQADGKAKPALGVDALPDSAQICSCNDVSKGAIAMRWRAAPATSANGEKLHQAPAPPAAAACRWSRRS